MIKGSMFILETDEGVRTRVARFFAKKGFEVHSYENVSDMEKGFQEFGTPDVLVTDYELKKGDSLSLIERLRMKIKVIVCVTAFFDDEEARLKLYMRGCVDVKSQEQLESLYVSVILALENEPNWVIESANKL